MTVSDNCVKTDKVWVIEQATSRVYRRQQCKRLKSFKLCIRIKEEYIYLSGARLIRNQTQHENISYRLVRLNVTIRNFSTRRHREMRRKSVN